MSENIKILVVGAGAVGAYFGGRLALAGAEVSVVCRSDYDAVREHGYRVKSIAGDFVFNPQQVCRSAADYAGQADYILVAVKALPEINVAELVAPALHPDATVVLLQNGVEIEAPIQQAMPEVEFISGVAYIGVVRTGEGDLDHQGSGHLALGMFPPERPVSAKLQTLSELFKKVNVRCEISADIRVKRWSKLVWNAPFNPISVLGGCIDTKQMMDDSLLAELAENVMHEVVAAAAACGVLVPPEHVTNMLEYTRNFPVYKTSMLVDFENDRPLEVEVILGNAVRVAEAHGVPVPHLKTIYALLNSINNNRN
jgi:2-dehydropantoate 2-reductase